MVWTQEQLEKLREQAKKLRPVWAEAEDQTA